MSKQLEVVPSATEVKKQTKNLAKFLLKVKVKKIRTI